MKKLKPLRFGLRVNTDNCGNPLNITTHICPEIYSDYYGGKNINSDREFIFRELFGGILENLEEIKKTSESLNGMQLRTAVEHKSTLLLQKIEFLEKEIQNSLYND